MHKHKIIFLFHILLLAVFSTATFAADTVKIGENGKALATIEVAPQASVGTRMVAREMAHYLERMTGARFNVTNAPGTGTRIVLGRNNEFPNLKYGDKLRGNGQEAFLMRTEGDKVFLLGVTDQAASHAAYTFLERLGVRWFFPMEDWEIVPEVQTLTANFDEVQSPDMPLHRSIWYGGIHGGFDVNIIRQDWMRHNRMKPDGPAQSHSWIGLDPKKDFAEHPEWFALVNGKRRNTQPNYGHPEVIKKAVERGLAAAEAGADSISVSAPDGLGFCECDQCLQVAGVTRESVHKINSAIFGKRPDGTLVCVTSETIFRMANEVAKAVGKNHPNVLISIYAYSGYAHPPSFDLEPNIYVPVTSAYRRTPLSFEEQIQTYGNKARQIGVYDYYNFPIWHGYNPSGGKKIAELKESLKFYHANNVQGVNAEGSNNWGPAGLDFYVASKLMWDVDANVDAIYNDFLEKAFGTAKAPMKSYYDRWEAKVPLTPAAVGAAIEDLITAYRMADTEASKKRIAQLYIYMRFVRLDRERRDTKNDPEQIAQAAKEYADLAWRLKDTKLLHERVTYGVNRPMAPAFTVQEIESWMAEDTVWLKENRNLFISYSRNLVPITSVGKTIPGVQEKPIDSGTLREMELLILAQAGETIEIEFKSTGEASPYRITFMEPEPFKAGANAKQAKEVAKGDATDKVSYKVAETGFYRVQMRSIASVTSVSHAHSLEPGEYEMQNGTLYFFVPEGTKQFALSAGAAGGPTIAVRDATGKVVFEHKGYFATREKAEDGSLNATITVPPGTDGAVWSVTGPGDTNTKARFGLTGLQEYFSFSPHQLLVAEEYLK